MIPAELDTIQLYRGDMWRDTYHFGPMEDENGDPPLPQPAMYARMQFRNKRGVLGYELNSDPGVGEGTIIIVDGVNYEFSIPEQDLPGLTEGDWWWDFETYTTDPPGTTPPDTWFRGKAIVIQDISRD